jgi:hypothetical protein
MAWLGRMQRERNIFQAVPHASAAPEDAYLHRMCQTENFMNSAIVMVIKALDLPLSYGKLPGEAHCPPPAHPNLGARHRQIMKLITPVALFTDRKRA